MKKFRIYRVLTDETIIIIEAENLMEASFLTGKIFGADNEEVDIEEWRE